MSLGRHTAGIQAGLGVAQKAGDVGTARHVEPDVIVVVGVVGVVGVIGWLVAWLVWLVWLVWLDTNKLVLHICCTASTWHLLT